AAAECGDSKLCRVATPHAAPTHARTQPVIVICRHRSTILPNDQSGQITVGSYCNAMPGPVGLIAMPCPAWLISTQHTWFLMGSIFMLRVQEAFGDQNLEPSANIVHS
ncbi:hypothetical protein RRG08_049625, partial [Elysia crispata]